MAGVVLDADMLSEVLNRQDTTVLSRFGLAVADEGAVGVAAPALYEVLYGLHRRRAAEKLRRLHNLGPHLTVLPFDADAAELAARFAAELDGAGDTIGRLDPQIAAVAVVNRRTLVTGNTRHFERVRSLDPRLTLANWRT